MADSSSVAPELAESTAKPNDVELVLLDLWDQDQATEFMIQRRACGWAYSQQHLEKWRELQDRKIKTFWWIVRAGVRVGHIALASKPPPRTPAPETPADPLALPDKTVLTLGALFVLQEHRKGGVAGAAVAAVERLAQQPPHGSVSCHTLTLDTLSRRYTEDDALRHVWADGGNVAPDKGHSAEDWYARRGYVKYREIKMYGEDYADADGGWWCVWMRKELPRQSA